MKNTLQIRHNNEGVPVALRLDGRTDGHLDVAGSYLLHQITLGELTDGQSKIIFDPILEAGNFPFTPTPHNDDPEGQVGKIHWDELNGLIGHTLRSLGDELPPRTFTQFEQDVEAMKRTLAALVSGKAVVYDKLSLEVFSDANGVIIGHEYKCEKTDNSESVFAANPHIVGIRPQVEGLPHAVLRWIDKTNNVEAEVVCKCGTNQLAGFRKIVSGGSSTSRVYTAEQAEAALWADGSSGESGGESGGDSD